MKQGDRAYAPRNSGHDHIVCEFRTARFYESDEYRQILREIETAVQHGRFIVLSGIVGCGKTTTLHRLQEKLAETGEVLAAKSLSVDKAGVSLATLLLALFYDPATEKDFVIPNKPEKRERALCELIRKRKKPVVLCIDDAHDLPRKTLADLKRCMKTVRAGGGILSVVLAGHPKLKENAGRQITVFSIPSQAMQPMRQEATQPHGMIA